MKPDQGLALEPCAASGMSFAPCCMTKEMLVMRNLSMQQHRQTHNEVGGNDVAKLAQGCIEKFFGHA